MTDQGDWQAPGTPARPSGAPSGDPRHGWTPAQPFAPAPAAPGVPSGWGPSPWGPPPPPRPGVIPLRPLGIGEILDGSISTLRSHPKAMLGLSLVVAVVVQLVTVPVTWLLLRDNSEFFSFGATAAPPPGEEFSAAADTISSAGVQGFVTFVAVIFLTGVLTAVVSRAVLGQPVSIGSAWRQAKPRLPALFGVTALVALLVLLLATITIGPGLVLGALGAPTAGVAVALVVGVPAFIVAAIYFTVAFALAPSAAVLERQRPVAALRRARALIKGAWWRTAIILLLVNLLALFIGFLLSLPFSVLSMIAAAVTGGGDRFNMFGIVPLVIGSIGSIISSAITWPFSAAATVLVYVDRRMRREGLDLELARAAARPVPGATGSSPAAGTSSGGPPASYQRS